MGPCECVGECSDGEGEEHRPSREANKIKGQGTQQGGNVAHARPTGRSLLGPTPESHWKYSINFLLIFLITILFIIWNQSFFYHHNKSFKWYRIDYNINISFVEIKVDQ